MPRRRSECFAEFVRAGSSESLLFIFNALVPAGFIEPGFELFIDFLALQDGPDLRLKRSETVVPRILAFQLCQMLIVIIPDVPIHHQHGGTKTLIDKA